MTGAEQTFPGTAASLAKARAWARDHLGACGVAPQVVDDVLLVLSELAANAVCHSRSGAPQGTYRVRLEGGGARVRVAVTDGGAATAPAARRGVDAGPVAESGHGLLLVDALSAGWRVRGTPRSWTVTADIPAA